jgi:hypothetical protein
MKRNDIINRITDFVLEPIPFIDRKDYFFTLNFHVPCGPSCCYDIQVKPDSTREDIVKQLEQYIPKHYRKIPCFDVVHESGRPTKCFAV